MKAIRGTIWKNLGSKYESKDPNPYPKKKIGESESEKKEFGSTTLRVRKNKCTEETSIVQYLRENSP
jgi:hypothetical protein